MIKRNRANCSIFAESSRLNWLFNRLSVQQSSKGVFCAVCCAVRMF